MQRKNPSKKKGDVVTAMLHSIDFFCVKYYPNYNTFCEDVMITIRFPTIYFYFYFLLLSIHVWRVLV